MRNTVARKACQSAGVRRCKVRIFSGAISLIFTAGTVAHLWAQDAAVPPPWKRDLDAAHLLETTLAVTAPHDETEARSRDERLSALYQHLERQYPKEAEIQEGAADYDAARGRFSEAVAGWQRAAALAPGNPDLIERLAGGYMEIGESRKSAEAYRQLVRIKPDMAAYHFAFANLLFLFRHDLIAPPELPTAEAVLLEALAEFRRAAELAPADSNFARAYAETFYVLANPDWDEALAAWTQVRALAGAQTDFANTHLARVSLRMGKPAQAKGYLALLHDPAWNGIKAKLTTQADQGISAPRPSK